MKSRNRWMMFAAIFSLATLAAACAGMRPGGSWSQTSAQRKAALAYLANDDVDADIPQKLSLYTKVKAGDSQRIARTSSTSPPQVPHAIADLLPITIEENACLACHLPDNAGAGDIPIPPSHFRRPQIELALLRSSAEPHGQGMLSHVAGSTVETDLVGTRYNCIQCHTPRAEDAAAVK